MTAVTLITGASSGIGEAFARRLAREGHNLFLVARSRDRLSELCNELSARHPVKAFFFAVDLAAESSDEKVLLFSQEHCLEVTWLINNAGIGSMGDFAAMPLGRELEIIDLNIRAVVALTHRFLPQMRNRKSGIIINVSSAAGFQPLPFMATYAATKSFVTSFSEALAEENRPCGIQILALCPGSTDTAFFRNAGMDRSFSFKGQQTPEEVVETALRAVRRRR
ncbi:MAG: hypothetical protein C4325_02335, partial [Blastocatellia bacterium]